VQEFSNLCRSHGDGVRVALLIDGKDVKRLGFTFAVLCQSGDRGIDRRVRGD
jgi:hypothetical protein